MDWPAGVKEGSDVIELNGQEVKFDHYPNGESRIDRSSLNPNNHASRVIVRYESDEDLIHLMLLNAVMDEWGVERHIFFSHFPYARMDRAPQGSRVFALSDVVKFVNWMNFDSVTVADPHSDVTPALLDQVSVVSVMDALVAKAYDSMDLSNSFGDPYVVFPDSSAAKRYERFGTFFGQKDFFIGLKHRDFGTGEIAPMKILFSEPRRLPSTKDATAILIDDICSRGGTFIGASEALKSLYRFKRVYLITAHCEQVAWAGDLWKHVDHVFTTDSMVERWPVQQPQASAPVNFITRFSQSELLEMP